VDRLDVRGGSFSTIASASEASATQFKGVAVGEGAVWALTYTGTILRIDPATKKVLKIPLASAASTGAIAVGDGAVWVRHDRALRFGQAVSRVDPVTNDVSVTIELTFAPAGLAVGRGSRLADEWGRQLGLASRPGKRTSHQDDRGGRYPR